MNNLSKSLIGIAGSYFVAAELTQRGFIATVTSRNTEGIDITNLWPEAASPKPGFHEKDKVENYLHNQVCAGKMALQAAQQAIVSNWTLVYQKISQ
jgi:hypothetical protein